MNVSTTCVLFQGCFYFFFFLFFFLKLSQTINCARVVAVLVVVVDRLDVDVPVGRLLSLR